MPKNGPRPYWLPVKEALTKIHDSPAEPRNILILGAGIAGLAAAYELGKLKKHKVHLVEASKRIGGRIWTHRFPVKVKEGETPPYHELGAMRIPELTHDYTWNYLLEMGLKTREFFNDDPMDNGHFDIKGEVFRVKNANKEFIRLFPGMNDAEKELVSSKGVGALLRRYIDPLKAELEAKGLVSRLVNGQMNHPYLNWLDSQSVRTYFIGLEDTMNMTKDAAELIGKALSFESLWSWSLAQFLRGDYTNSPQTKDPHRAPKLYEVIGGLDLLPRAIHQKITDEMQDWVNIHMNIEAKGIRLNPNGSPTVALYDRESGQAYTELVYDQVLCTIPFPVMRLMDLKGLSLPKISAIRNLEYTSSTKVLLLCKNRFWEDEQILGGRSVSDRQSRQTYYPSDFLSNEEQTPKATDLDQVTFNVGQKFWSIHIHSSSKFNQVRGLSNRPDKKPYGVILASYSWTDNSRQIGKLSKEDYAPGSVELENSALSGRAEKVMEDIKHFHGEIAEHVEASISIYWDEYPWSRGAFAITPPGDLTAYYQDGRKPEGRLFFAGEHISIAPGWIQGALESSLAAVAEMLQQEIV